jgi:sulfide:quinone oxidoreductase
MSETSPSRTQDALRVVIAGGGVAGLEVLLALHELAGDLVDVELIAPEHHFWYRPLAVAEPFGQGRAHRFELAGLVAAAGARFTPGELRVVDASAHVLRTTRDADIPYDALVIACGARPRPALPGAFTFRGPADTEAFRRLIDGVRARRAGRLVFAVPLGVAWPLPIYELALLTATEIEETGVDGVELTLVTHESKPLALFGLEASTAVRGLLAEREVGLQTGRVATVHAGGELRLVLGDAIPADCVVAAPRLVGPAIDGLPRDREGFIPCLGDGSVRGLADVYAAGDAVSFPVKQGGIAAQQADAVAEAIAACAGAPVKPRPFSPILYAVLLTGKTPLFIRTDVGHGSARGAIAAEPLWRPAAKVAGRHLTPFLASYGKLPESQLTGGPAVGSM